MVTPARPEWEPQTSAQHSAGSRRRPDGLAKRTTGAIARAISQMKRGLADLRAVVSHDVARRSLSVETLLKLRSELAHATRVTSLGALTASIAHEVCQPLASILLNSQSSLGLLARPEPDIDKIREIIGRVLADARRATEIVDRIRAMTVRRTPEQKPLSLDEVIEESMVFLRHEFQSKGISVALELAPAPLRVLGDRTQLQQVIVNLVINAIQAMAQTKDARPSIVIRTLSSSPQTVCCMIEDSGPGIDPAHLPHLFDSFYSTKNTGMGMGLAISRSIVEAHAGCIRADNNSTLGGARFTITLPAEGRPS